VKYTPPFDAAKHTVIWQRPDPRSLEDQLAEGLVYELDEPGGVDAQHRDISDEERELFAGLLVKLLQYKPEDRLVCQGSVGAPVIQDGRCDKSLYSFSLASR